MWRKSVEDGEPNVSHCKQAGFFHTGLSEREITRGHKHYRDQDVF